MYTGNSDCPQTRPTCIEITETWLPVPFANSPGIPFSFSGAKDGQVLKLVDSPGFGSRIERNKKNILSGNVQSGNLLWKNISRTSVKSNWFASKRTQFKTRLQKHPQCEEIFTIGKTELFPFWEINLKKYRFELSGDNCIWGVLCASLDHSLHWCEIVRHDAT